MEKKNKVQFNLKNVHYAVITEGEDGSITFGTPVHVLGAVSLSLEPQGDVNPFYADGIVYYRSIANNGYNGDLEMAKFPDQMLQDVWGQTITETEKVLIENSNVEPLPFALLFQIDGDKDNELYCMYNCMGTRPGIASDTNTESKEPKTQSSTITSSPMEDGTIRARTTAETPVSTKANWFKEVFKPTAEAAVSAAGAGE